MKLQYIDLHLKTKRAFTNKFFKQHNITFENINPKKLFSLNFILCTNPTKDRAAAFYEMLISETIIELDLVKRFEIFLNTPSNTETFFRLKYGDVRGLKEYQERINKIIFGNSLEGYIKKYGVVDGTKKFNVSKSKRVHTLENFVRLYGEDEGKKNFELTMSKKGQSLERFITLYGEQDGTLRFNEWKGKCRSTEENFINRHGTELGKQKWLEFKSKSKSTKENFINRHGMELGEEKYKQYCQRSANTKENFIRVYGIEEGTNRWNNYKNSNAGYKASKESLDFFEPLTKQLLSMGIELQDIWYGGDDSLEFKIESNNKLYSYDYTILSKKIIIEYNGNHVHPSKELLGTNWDSWRCAWSGETADEKYQKDLEKIMVAEKEGFSVIEIWDFKDKTQSLKQCLDLIRRKN